MVPAIRDWNPQARDALFGVVQDATADPKARRKAALKITEFLLPKVAKKGAVMLAELNEIGSEDEAAKWARRRMREKNKLNAADAKHIEEAFRAKLMSFAIHRAEGEVPEPKPNAQSAGTEPGRGNKRRFATQSVDKTPLMHPEPRRVRDRDHVRYVAQQACLVCGRQPCDAHHLRFAQDRALGHKVSDEFTVPLCRGHHRELHRHGDEAAWWQKSGIDPTGAARALWLETHPLP